MPQPPQCAVVLRVSTSQPSAALPLQSAKPVLQLATRAHARLAHAATPLGASQRVPQLPQRVTVVRVSVSHPLVASPSQSAKPVLHAYAQRAASHDAVALARGAQAIPQPPQWATVTRVSTSQPLVGSRSQSPTPSLHELTTQRPLLQPAEAPASEQRIPQAPQFALLLSVSTHAPAQQVWPVAHGCVALHPMTQVLPTQRLPGGQWASTMHATHSWRESSQRCAGPRFRRRRRRRGSRRRSGTPRRRCARPRRSVDRRGRCRPWRGTRRTSPRRRRTRGRGSLRSKRSAADPCRRAHRASQERRVSRAHRPRRRG